MRTLTLAEVREGAARAAKRVAAWPRWKRELSMSTKYDKTFSQALEHLKSGGRAARSGWNGKNMSVRLYIPSPEELSPYVEMRTADGMLVPWLCSQTDMLAEDWGLV